MTAASMCVNCFRDLAGSAFCTACGWPAQSPPTSPLHLPPRILLKETYILGRVLGHGGFGITYAAYDPALDRRLAIKEYLPNGEATRGTGEARIHPLSGASEEAFRWGLEKFLEEARVLVRFQDHPGIVKVITFFSENGTAYLVMEHLEGQNLETRLQQIGGKISFASALQAMMPVIDALREVHKAGILHRDISPDNVFLCDNRQIKLIDFGAARYAMGEKSKSLSILIKDGYAPEEQYRTKGKQGPWTDVYAVSATIYRAITGSLPPTSLDRLHDDDLHDPRALGAEISESAWQVLQRGLAVRAADRYASMEEFQAALMATPEGQGIPVTAVKPAPPPPPIPPPAPPIVIPTPVPYPWWRRYRMGLASAAVALVAGVFALQRSCGESEAAVIAKFQATPAKIQASSQATLEWKVSGANEVQIEPGIGKRTPEGSLAITPLASTTYVITARNAEGKEVRQEFRVEVEAVPAPTPTPEPTPETTPTPDATPTSMPNPEPTREQAPGPSSRPQPKPQAFPPSNSQTTPTPLPPQVTPPPTQSPSQPPTPHPYPPQSFPPTESNRTRNPLAPQPGSFLVHHDHQGVVGGILGSNRVNQIWQHCTGRLYVSNGRLTFQSNQSGHSFNIPLKQIKEIKSNRMALAGRKAFHVHVEGGEKYNFVPEGSVQEIVEALNASLK